MAGCKLVLCARRLEELKRVKAELEKLTVVRNMYLISLTSFMTYYLNTANKGTVIRYEYVLFSLVGWSRKTLGLLSEDSSWYQCFACPAEL